MLEVFLTKSRSKKMVCVLEQPDPLTDNNILVLFCHGFVGNKITPHRMAPNLSRILVQDGYSMLRADCIGAGDSEGDSKYMTIQGEVSDHEAAYQQAQHIRTWDHVILLGYSLGGTVASLLTEKIQTKGLILWAPVSNPYENIKHILGEDRFASGLSGNDEIGRASCRERV